MRRRSAGIAVIALAASLLLPRVAAALTVTDDRGVAVELAQPADRVVSLAPFITELVFAVGAGSRLVAVSEHSDYPAAARELPRIGNAFSVQLERLLAASPDLVLSWQTGIDPRVVQRLESMGIPVFVLEPRDIDAVASALRRIGRLLGTAEAAERAAKRFSATGDEIRKQYADRPTVSVFYQISAQPIMTLNGRHMVSAVLALCGATNVFADLGPIAPSVNREQVLARDPEVILISTRGGRPSPQVEAWRRYDAITAVRYDNVYTVDGDLLNRQTPRLLDGARTVCAILDRARERLARPESR